MNILKMEIVMTVRRKLLQFINLTLSTEWMIDDLGRVGFGESDLCQKSLCSTRPARRVTRAGNNTTSPSELPAFSS